jgi:signal peptidase I
MTTDDAPHGGAGSTAPGRESPSATQHPQQTVAQPVEPAATAPSSSASTATRTTARRDTADGKARPKRKSFFRELPGIVITALLISVLIKTFLVQAFYIPSGSMENTLLVNDRVLVNKLADKPDEIHRGDVVVFRDPGGWLNGPEVVDRGGVLGAVRDALVFVGLAPAAGEEDLIKRVIGVGGDTVEADKNGVLKVNGVPLAERGYLYPRDSSSLSPFKVTVREGELWVMGDHRSVSEDSRAHRQQPGEGFVPVDDVIGRAFTIVWPLDRARLMHRPDTFQQPQLDASAP